MKSAPSVRLVIQIPLFFVALFAGRIVLGQTVGSASSVESEEERAKRLKWLKARAPELRPMEGGAAEPVAAKSAPPTEKSAAAKAATPAPASRTAKESGPKAQGATDGTGRSTTAKTETTK